MARLLLFYRLMVRPLLSEPVRTALTVLAIALGVGVVLAIDLAGTAAAGSFRSSMETLAKLNVNRGRTFQSSWKNKPNELHGGC